MKRSRTLMYDVASFVIHAGKATIEDVTPKFPGFTQYQLRRALQNASQKGIIKCLHNGQQKGVKGCGSATYGPRDAKPLDAPVVPKGRMVANSVFDMSGVSVPAAKKGQVRTPLGGW